RALAGAAEKAGVRIRYGTTVSKVEVRGERAVAVRTEVGERVPADVVVLNAELRRRARMTYSPSCVVVHIGSKQPYGAIAHHNIHFGRAWRSTFDEVIRQGRLMSDPSLLLTNPSRTDPSLAPPGLHTYYLLAPAPNLALGRQDWRGGLAQRY